MLSCSSQELPNISPEPEQEQDSSPRIKSSKKRVKLKDEDSWSLRKYPGLVSSTDESEAECESEDDDEFPKLKYEVSSIKNANLSIKFEGIKLQKCLIACKKGINVVVLFQYSEIS